jgi:NADH-quinone oxidoreductase subunit A
MARGGDLAVHSYLGQYGIVGLVLLTGVALLVGAFTMSSLLRPRRPTPEKLLSYECGVDPEGADWSQTQIRYYVYAFLYVVFAVESVFLFPWVTIFSKPHFGTTALVEMGVFVAFLALGLLYAWRKKVLTWV